MREHPEGTLVAYADNAAVIEGAKVARLRPDAQGVYRSNDEYTHIVMKVETHNHPTAISPFPGAATGSGGEIRDEGATGRGAKPKAGLTGFTVSHLRIPGFRAAVGAERLRPAGPHRLAAADHARRPDRRRPASTTSSGVPICWATSAPSSSRWPASSAAITSRS